MDNKTQIADRRNQQTLENNMHPNGNSKTPRLENTDEGVDGRRRLAVVILRLYELTEWANASAISTCDCADRLLGPRPSNAPDGDTSREGAEMEILDRQLGLLELAVTLLADEASRFAQI